MPKYTIHVISHTHWDREWYMPFEKHRRRLVMLLDSLLDLMDKDPDFKHFHTDGQTIPIEDYLEIRPHQRQNIENAVKKGRLSLGPWYVLQDEFLTSGEANIRNMILGLKIAGKYGKPIKIGYLPDSFGNISQMPQILNGFGIDNAVFGRGINPCQEKYDKNDEPEARGYKSELVWRSPDGSEVLGIFMANWYANAMMIPTDPNEVLNYVNRVRDACLRYATTSHLLFMNGCDHTPSQPDVTKAIKLANEQLLDAVMIHSNFTDYIASVKAEVQDQQIKEIKRSRDSGTFTIRFNTEAHDLQIKDGELRNEHTDGWGTLTNVLSSRIYQKQANWRCQTLLEKWVEPFSAIAYKLGYKYDSDLIWYAWKTLMQNHPHDSICGCSCDEVHREMDTRFEKCQILAEQLGNGALEKIIEKIDIQKLDKEAVKVVVFNPINVSRREMVTAMVDFPKDTEINNLMVLDVEGNNIPSFVLEDMGIVWDYELPEVGFRVPYNARRLRLAFLASVPGIGYATYQIKPTDDKSDICEFNALENEHLSVEILNDGRLNITDKESGFCFKGLNQLQDSLDVGDEYNYRALQEDEVISPCASDTTIGSIIGNGVYSECTIETKLYVRGKPMSVKQTLMLVMGSRLLYVRTAVLNKHENHRLRVLFPTDIKTNYASADGQFDVIKRRILPWKGWKNPSNCQPQQAFVDVSDEEKGLTIANRGLPEYEILRDGRNTIAITLLRAVDRLGDWGVFPTPEAQCMGHHVFEYAIIPHASTLESSLADLDARSFNAPFAVAQVKKSDGKLSPIVSFIDLQPQKLVLSSIKKAEDRDNLIVRFYNPYDELILGTLTTLIPVGEVYLCNLAEERQEKLECIGGVVTFEVIPKKIITFEICFQSVFD
jgi:alpha-mannosidase/mannosylglycerate hydrolase